MNLTELTQKAKDYILERLDDIIDKIDGSGPIKNAEDLRRFELSIAAETDNIAGKLMETVLKRAVNESRVQEEAKALIKNSQTRMKNHGKRDVTIHPYRGKAFTVKATYFCRAGLSGKEGKKRGLVFSQN